ncbi:hypothetical protein U5640_16875 [Streptomyces sp. SS7]|uniref:hypothetical protein n=1 Tax=Streptomyces sp. SS7 TaxID=3108485 RepID=UPI0030EC0836
MSEEAQRIRELVARNYSAWSGFEPRGDRAHALRTLLWEIDHPSAAEQTAEIWSNWLDGVEPRWPDDNTFVHPEWVEKLRRDGERTCAEIAAARRMAN